MIVQSKKKVPKKKKKKKKVYEGSQSQGIAYQWHQA